MPTRSLKYGTFLWGALIVAATTLLFASFRFNTLDLGSGAQRAFETYNAESEILVLNRIAETRVNGWQNLSGFLILPDARGPYFSQCGLQGWILPYFCAVKFQEPDVKVAAGAPATIVALINAMTLIALCLVVAGRWGKAAGVVLFTLLLCTKWLTIFGANIYWVYFTQLAPLLFSWMFAERAFTTRQIGFYVGLSALITIRAMCGYEYFTNVALGTIIPLIYFALTESGYRPKLVSAVARALLAIGIGLINALVIHSVQFIYHFQSLSIGLSYLKNRFIARTYGGSEVSAVPESTTQLKILMKYWNYDVLRVPHYFEVSLKQIIFLSVATGVGSAVFAIRRLSKAERVPEIVVWPILCLLGLFVSWSWQILFKGHMYHHDFLNMMVYLFPFLITCYLACAVGIARIGGFLKHRMSRGFNELMFGNR